jgi:hypothetical protein
MTETREQAAVNMAASEVCRLTKEEADWLAISTAIGALGKALKKLRKSEEKLPEPAGFNRKEGFEQ